MVVEVAGCSGAGKTTLLRAIFEELRRKRIPVANGADIVSALTRTGWIAHEPARNVALQMLLLPSFRRAAKNDREFLQLSRAQISRNAESRFDWLSRTLALRRQVAVHFLLRRWSGPSVVLVDEGIAGSIHSALVQSIRPVEPSDVNEFVVAMPRPDLTIHLDVPVEVCVVRALSRPDPPLRWAGKDALARYVRHGHEAYRVAAAVASNRGWQTLSAEPEATSASLAREAVALLS